MGKRTERYNEIKKQYEQTIQEAEAEIKALTILVPNKNMQPEEISNQQKAKDQALSNLNDQIRNCKAQFDSLDSQMKTGVTWNKDTGKHIKKFAKNPLAIAKHPMNFVKGVSMWNNQWHSATKTFYDYAKLADTTIDDLKKAIEISRAVRTYGTDHKPQGPKA